MQGIVSGYPSDCGGSCPLTVYVEDGEIRRIAPEEGPDTPSAPRLRPCARGLANVHRIYRGRLEGRIYEERITRLAKERRIEAIDNQHRSDYSK